MLEHSFFMFLLANMFLLKLLLFAGFQWGTSRGVKKRQGKAWYAWSFEHFDGFAVGTFGTFLMAQRQSQRQSQRAVPPLGVAWSGPFPTANWIENCGPLGTCAKKSKHFDLMRQVSPTAGPLDVEWWTHMIFFGIWDSNEGRRLTEFLDRSTRGLVRISEGWEVSQYQEPMERWLASEDRCYAIALCPLLQTSVKCVCKYMGSNMLKLLIPSSRHIMKMLFCAGVYLSLHATTTCGQKLKDVHIQMPLWASSESVRAKWLLGPGPPSTRTTWSTTDAYIRVHQKPRVWNAMTGIYLLL